MILFAGWGGLQGAIVKRIDELTAKSAAKGALLFEIPAVIVAACCIPFCCPSCCISFWQLAHSF